MATDQKKKRVNASSLVDCTSGNLYTSGDQYRVKKKRLELPQHNLRTRPNISLEWDNKKKNVVSKREQIGLSRRHLIPFIELSPHGHNMLADVFSVPKEMYDMKNLSKVLSYEVWQSHLSEEERSFLSQFLPKEAEPNSILRDLLAGNNFHFGNPFLNWGTSVCCGELHPDIVLHEEQSVKACKKAYHLDLQKYHNDMIKNLQTWKQKWANFNEPEVDIMKNIWRSRKHAEKILPRSETRIYETEENIVTTPESCSWANSEKAFSSDNQNMVTVQGESQRRKGFTNNISEKGNKFGNKLHKRNIQRGDGEKYMSYIKISKEQHEQVKSSMKHSGNSIRPRSLNNILGSIDALNVQPFERFEEEERNNLHNYWLKLANKDIPEGLATWKKRKLQRHQGTQSLSDEIEQKVERVEAIEGEKKECSEENQMELSDDSEEETLPIITIKGVEKEQSDDLLQEQMNNEKPIHEVTEEIENEMESKSDYAFEEQTYNDNEMIEEDNDEPEHVFIQEPNLQQIASSHDNSPRVSAMIEPPKPLFFHNQHQQQIASLISIPQEMQTRENSLSAKTDGNLPIVSDYPGNLNPINISVSHAVPLPSASVVWPAGDVHGSYYQSTVTNDGYAPTRELSLGHPQFIQNQELQNLDLEANRQDKDSGKNMLNGDSNGMPFFNSFSNLDRNELLQSLFKGQNNLSYHHNQKQPGLQFQPRNDLIMEPVQFPQHLTEPVVHPSLPLDMRQKNIYMHHSIQEGMYSDGNRYNTISRPEQLPVNIHDWTTDVRSSAPSQPELGPNWYVGQNGSRDGWPAFENVVGVNHSLNTGSNSDQTLYSVLSECNELRSGTSYNNSVGPTERLIQSGNYGGISGGVLSSSSNILQPLPNPLNYLSGHEPTAAGLNKISNNIGWIGLPPQNNGSGIQESMGKQFLRSWNQ